LSSDKKTILITGTTLVPEEAADYIRHRGYQVRSIRQDNFTAEELHAALVGVSGYLIGGYEEPLAEHFDVAKSLEAVAWVGTDYKTYVPGWERAYELGIAFLNAPGTNAASVAEFTTLLILTMMRPFTDRIMKAGAKPADLSGPGHDLLNKRLGIIGLGRIGAHVARIAALGLGMDVVYSAPRRQEELEQALPIRYVAKDELLSTSDVVTLHRPGPSPSEAYELGAHEIALMKVGAVLINTARHQLVDLDALLKAATDRGVRAAFDGVATGEIWDALFRLGPERFLAVPSMAFNTEGANLRASLRTAEGVCDVLDGGTSDDVNNPDFREQRRSR